MTTILGYPEQISTSKGIVRSGTMMREYHGPVKEDMYVILQVVSIAEYADKHLVFCTVLYSSDPLSTHVNTGNTYALYCSEINTLESVEILES